MVSALVAISSMSGSEATDRRSIAEEEEWWEFTLVNVFFRERKTLGKSLTCQWGHFADGGAAVRHGLVSKLFLVDGQQVCNPVVQPHAQDELTNGRTAEKKKEEKSQNPTATWANASRCCLLLIQQGASYLQNLNNLQLGVHHHHVFVVGQEVAFAVAQGRRRVGEAVRHAATHHHLSHHFTHAVDGAQHVVACRATQLPSHRRQHHDVRLLKLLFYVKSAKSGKFGS